MLALICDDYCGKPRASAPLSRCTGGASSSHIWLYMRTAKLDLNAGPLRCGNSVRFLRAFCRADEAAGKGTIDPK